MKRIVPLPLFAAFACLFIFLSDARPEAISSRLSTSEQELRFMSFNIWVNGGRSLTKCIEAIQLADADIVGLQECNAATAQTIAAQLGYHYHGVNDVSIVSRFPIASIIPTSGGSGVTIEIRPGQRVHLFNCHLPAYPYGPYSIQEGQSQNFVLNQEVQTRMPALNNLLSGMAPFINGPEPCFLVGDFNAPSHLDYSNYPWPTSLACIAAGLSDSYKELHPNGALFPPGFAFDRPGITWTPMTSQEPNGVFDRIDFVYHSQSDGLVLLECSELDERNSATPWPSDHRAVLSRYRLPEPVLAEQASSPIPEDHAADVSLPIQLNWLPGTETLSHDVYFGTVSPGVFQGNQMEASFAPTQLLADTTYYWRIDEVKSSGTITGPIWSFKTRQPHVYEWDFAHGNLTPLLGTGTFAFADAATSNLTEFGVSDGSTIPHLQNNPVHYLHAPAFVSPSNGYRLSFPGTKGNGGGAYINQFTCIWDLLLRPPLGWTPLFNTNPQNANDADFYIDPNGALGIGVIGYSPTDTLHSGQWHRIAFTADLAANQVRYFADGQLVFTGAATLDGRHSLYSDVDSGPDLLLFNEGDSSGVYTHEVFLSRFFFTDRTLSMAEVAALGGPKTEAIGLALLPIQVNAVLDGDQLRLTWTGGVAPYKLQRTMLLNSSWEDVGMATTDTSLTVPLQGSAAYYRVVSSGN